MRNWAFLVCRTIGLVCGVYGVHQLIYYLQFKWQMQSASGSDVWGTLLVTSPVYFLFTAFLLYVGADFFSRMLIPESRDGDMNPPAMSVREFAAAAWSIVGIWFVVKSAPKLLYYFGLWLWSKAGAPPQAYIDELEKLGREMAWSTCEFAIGAIVFVLAARRLGFKSEA